MPQIIVMADTSEDTRKWAVMFTERVTTSDFESRHFQHQLVERLGWAVGDADAVEQRRPMASRSHLPEPAREAVSNAQPAS